MSNQWVPLRDNQVNILTTPAEHKNTIKAAVRHDAFHGGTATFIQPWSNTAAENRSLFDSVIESELSNVEFITGMNGVAPGDLSSNRQVSAVFNIRYSLSTTNLHASSF
jgi:hypothetical protein